MEIEQTRPFEKTKQKKCNSKKNEEKWIKQEIKIVERFLNK